MQLTPAQRRFYIDPVQDPTLQTDTILVTEERTRGRAIHIDKVVKVRKDRVNLDYRTWWVTESGDYVMGAPVNHHRWPYGSRIIGVGGDDWFWLATPGRMIGTKHLCSNPRRSDGKQLPVTPGNPAGSNFNLELPTVVRAAPWAEELFPAPGDSDGVVLAKLALAERRWTYRNAKAEIIRQGMGRGWTDDLATLKDEHKLPEATFGAYFSGQVMLESASLPTLSTRDQTRLDELKERVPVPTNATPRMMVGMKVTVPLALDVTDHEGIRKLPSHELNDAVRSAVGDYSAVPYDYSLSPVLRSIA